jgi:hypothetical protein
MMALCEFLTDSHENLIDIEVNSSTITIPFKEDRILSNVCRILTNNTTQTDMTAKGRELHEAFTPFFIALLRLIIHPQRFGEMTDPNATPFHTLRKGYGRHVLE